METENRELTPLDRKIAAIHRKYLDIGMLDIEEMMREIAEWTRKEIESKLK